MKYSLFLISILIGFTTCKPQEKLSNSSNEKELKTIAFGSCNKSNLPQTIWPYIGATHPDLWVWMGDIIYADSRDMHVMESMYDSLKMNRNYAAFIKNTPAIGTWDDHDYGEGDGNKYYPKKEESKKLMLEFLDVPDNADVRKHTGVYQSYDYGKIRVILLDLRSFQDSLSANDTGTARYKSNEGDLMGEEQWQWLGNELSESKASVNIIISSIQFLANEQGFEKWGNFPNSRKRMLELLQEKKPKNAIFLSGDRHMAEVSKLQLPKLSYPLYDITSSGMTHSYEKADEPNALRVGKIIPYKNFGLLHFNWKPKSVQIGVEILGNEGQKYISQDLGVFDF